MTEISGGWTLVMKIDGGWTSSDGWTYGSGGWTLVTKIDGNKVMIILYQGIFGEELRRPTWKNYIVLINR